MKRLIIVLLALGAASSAPASMCYAQPGEWGFGRLERFGPPRNATGPAQPNPLVDSLVAYYGLEESSGTRYDGRGTNHLTAYNNPGDTAGVMGRAAKFDNTIGQYLQTASPNMAVMQGDWSVMFWARVGNAGATDPKYVLGRGTSLACNSMEYLVVIQSGNALIRACDGTTRQIVVTAPSVWKHYTIRFKQSVDSLFVVENGVAIAKTHVPNPIINISPFTIGATGSGSYPLYGIVDELYFWRGYFIPDGFLAWYFNSGLGRSFIEVLAY